MTGDDLYDALNALNHQFRLIAAILLVAQIFLCTRTRGLWAFIVPIVTMCLAVYWMGNPLPTGQLPIMTAFYTLPWFGLTVLLLLVALVCRYAVKKKSKPKD